MTAWYHQVLHLNIPECPASVSKSHTRQIRDRKVKWELSESYSACCSPAPRRIIACCSARRLEVEPEPVHRRAGQLKLRRTYERGRRIRGDRRFFHITTSLCKLGLQDDSHRREDDIARWVQNRSIDYGFVASPPDYREGTPCDCRGDRGPHHG
ncbi:hypothetical protein EDB92DRAFT_1349947 [Lactarius akahatsu]|uniref:Uncharacterized protein n=1 Tax=Lactarius akahatsu TaxID=416441 RepID=A0AAD4L233_9AGAM|nr:hypothetical protein EDB92DRAFT_1349947 [Lactarius akahatsu]